MVPEGHAGDEDPIAGFEGPTGEGIPWQAKHGRIVIASHRVIEG